MTEVTPAISLCCVRLAIIDFVLFLIALNLAPYYSRTDYNSNMLSIKKISIADECDSTLNYYSTLNLI